jgi:hypothetical protein
MHQILVWILTAWLSVSGLPSLYAQDVSPSTPDSEHSLPDIIVLESAYTTSSGTSVLDRNAIDIIPHSDGSVTDLMRVLPGIQYSETERSSLSGGEILPAEISITGGRVYENNFLIDGIGNNSILDPMADNPMSVTNVPGHSQEMFLDTSLIDSVTVQRSNISARYSGFTGGVVEMETRDPSREFQFKTAGRTTRSEWTSFHISADEENDFYTSEKADQQPEFRKYYHSLSMDIPITQHLGIMLAYSHNYSRIPLMNFGVEQRQYRRQENFFAKTLYQPTDKTRLSFTFLSTPYEAQYFRDNVKESDFTLEGGGWGVQSKLEEEFTIADLELSLGYRESENKRRAPGEYFNYQVTESASWGDRFSAKGGYGDLDTMQETLTLAAHMEFKPFSRAGIQQTWSGGVSVERSLADYTHSGTTNSGWESATNVQCGSDDKYCLAQEQYADSRVVYPQDTTAAEITFTDAYLEDILRWKRISLRGGIHLSYNDFTRNNDYAGRSTIAYDLYGNGTTIFSLGANRYYGKTYLTHALDEQKAFSSRWNRTLNDDGTLNPWEESERRVFSATRVSDLETPRSDEWSISLEQGIPHGLITLSYIRRNGVDQLAKHVLDIDEYGYIYSEWNNNGESRHEEVNFSWEQRWETQYLMFNLTWQDSESSNESYSDVMDLEDMQEMVYYNGNLTPLVNLPRSDYNREWSANLVYHVKLGYGFAFTNIAEYRSGYAAILDTKENVTSENGEKFDLYADFSRPSSTTFDWKLTWEYDLASAGNVMLSAEVYNVFNRKLYTGIDGEYEMGRQLWVGLDYTF